MNTRESGFKIRSAQPDDKKIVNTILSGFKLPLDGLEKTLLWVLQSSEGAIVGVAGLEIYGSQGLLRSVAVSESIQSQGCGTLLVNYVLGEAKKRAVESLFLLTTTAPDFFERLGFKEENREKVVGAITGSVEFISACPKTAVLMHLQLS